MKREINLFEETVDTTSVLKERFNEIHTSIGDHLFQSKHDKLDERTLEHMKRLIEALLFASCDPLPLTKIREIVDQLVPVKPKTLKDLLADLQNEYLIQKRGFRLDEIAQGYLIRTCEEFSPYIELLYRNKRSEKLSQAAAEVLAIIAYRQPITRPKIESIRGVDSSGVITSLLERGLITAVGKLEAPGRPTLYGITNDFLSHFGLKDIEELPMISEDNKKEG